MTATKFDAMAFYHPHGLNPAWAQALLFAGESGRIATLPDIIDSRLMGDPRTAAWSSYFTTSSAEYYGLSRQGNPVLAVAHGTGPMSTLQGCVEGYPKDKDGSRRGGRIDRAKFLKLLDGEWGHVHVVDWNAYVSSRGEDMIHALSVEAAATDAWTVARLGGEERTAAYVEKHAEFADTEVEENRRGEPREDKPKLQIYENRDSQGASYTKYDFSKRDMVPRAVLIDDGNAFAHLLSIGQLCNTSRHGSLHPVLTTEVSPHDWTDGTRFAGLRNGPAHVIHPGIDVQAALASGDSRLWDDVPVRPGFDLVIDVDGKPFTAYPKAGAGLDTGEPMCAVISAREVGQACYETKPSGYYGFFKYPLSDIRRIAPAEANAYEIVGNPWLEGEVQKADVRFLRIEADRSRRLMRAEDIYRNASLLIDLAESQA